MKPRASDFPAYFRRYIALVPDGEILDILDDQLTGTLSFLKRLGEEVGNYRYAPEKWSIKEVVGHVIDTERVFNYRALCFARNDGSVLPSFDQEEYVEAAVFDRRTLISLTDEFRTVRESSILLFDGFSEEEWRRSGKTSEYTLSLRAIPFIIAGHERHHVNAIREKYLKKSI